MLWHSPHTEQQIDLSNRNYGITISPVQPRLVVESNKFNSCSYLFLLRLQTYIPMRLALVVPKAVANAAPSPVLRSSLLCIYQLALTVVFVYFSC